MAVLVRFGEFEVDLRAGELFKEGIKIRLQQQPFRVLALLLEHPGEVVTREDLRQAIWPAGTFVEFDVGLDAAIHKLRSALGDSAESPRLVETLPRRGYRFIAAVDSAVAPEAPRTRAAAIIASIVVLAAIALVWHPWSRPKAPPLVAVLYFEARDTADAYLADGLTEDVTSLLGSVASVQVKSPGAVRRAQRASPGDAPAIARALGVHYLLDGNVRRVGSRVRVSIRLLTGATAVAAWGDVFDRKPDELLALPSVIAQAVALTVFVLAGNTMLRPLVNAINRSPLDEKTSEATYYFKLAVTPGSLAKMRDRLVERLEAAQYPVANLDVVETGDDLLEIVATLVSTAIDPKELDIVAADLQQQQGVRHATWEVSTKD